MNNKAEYIKFASECKTLPIFSQPWWLDSVAENWDVAIVKKGGQIVGAWPYIIQKKLGLKISKLPPLTQKLGPIIIYPPGQKYDRKLAYEKEIIFALYQQIPKFHIFSQNLNYNITNVLPFHWLGFNTKVRYTYIIEPQPTEQTLQNFDRKTRNILKKAFKLQLTVEKTDDVKLLYDLVSKTFQRHNKPVPFKFQTLSRLDQQLKQRNSRYIFIACNQDNKPLAAIYLVSDSNSIYYLLGGIDASEGNSGATTLLIWKAIELAAEQNKIFDFEGSMNQSIERFFRGFGAKQKIIVNINKTSSKLLCMATCLKKHLI